MWPRRTLQDDLKARLDDLPAEFDTTAIGGATLVTGPTGVFVIMVHDGSTDRARGLGRLAATIRSAFAERMAWVPFVHALLIGDQAGMSVQATVVPAHMLTAVLTEGRRTLEDETRSTILELIATGALDGLESVAPDAGDARMAPCSDYPPATDSSSQSTISDPTHEDHTPSSRTQPASTASSGNRSRDS